MYTPTTLNQVDGCDEMHEDVYEALMSTTAEIEAGTELKVQEYELVKEYTIIITDPVDMEYELKDE